MNIPIISLELLIYQVHPQSIWVRQTKLIPALRKWIPAIVKGETRSARNRTKLTGSDQPSFLIIPKTALNVLFPVWHGIRKWK